jgi:hypothetical protein
VALIRLFLFKTQFDYWLLCVLAAAAGLVRPTMAIYGAGGVLVASWAYFEERHSMKSVVAGVGIYLAGASLLAGTNMQRFGSPAEFGHRLTISSDSMVYLTRFDNPFQSASHFSAAKELVGMLFLSPRIGTGSAFEEGLITGQAPQVRWRKFSFSTFDITYLGLALLGAMSLAWMLTDPRAGSLLFDWKLNLAISVWSTIAVGALGVFYLHFPTMESRYLLDFLPAFVGIVLVAWAGLANRLGWCAMPFLGGWLVYGMLIAQANVVQPIPTGPLPSYQDGPRIPLEAFQGSYNPDRHPVETGIALNGMGWDKDSSLAGDVVTLAVDDPQSVELHLSERRMLNGQPVGLDFYRAVMAGEQLPLQKTIRNNNELIVTFGIPDNLKNGSQILFLCFSKEYEAPDRDSERYLYSVRWHNHN